MKFTSGLSPITRRIVGDNVVFSNDYIRWEHDRNSGAFTGAFVTYGSNENLLAKPMGTVMVFHGKGGTLGDVDYRRGDVLSLEFGRDRVEVSFNLKNLKTGEVLQGLTVRHQVTYTSWGEAKQAFTFDASVPLENVFLDMVIELWLNKKIDMLTWRPQLSAGLGLWTLNNTPAWFKLSRGTRNADMFPLATMAMPLSIMAITRGVDGFEIQSDDDFDQWNVYRPDGRKGEHVEMGFSHAEDAYCLTLSPSWANDDAVISGCRTFRFSFFLPFVRKQMAPFRMGGHLFTGEADFDKRWPTLENLQERAAAGYDLLRLHNDGDSGNGIFWRDADYPPYPAEEMAKMDQCLKDAHQAGLSVVPYFSVKEFHPDAEGYRENAKDWARLNEAGGSMRTNRTYHGVFGSVMCLKSGWYKKRLDTIRQTLANHDFDGVYFDWCMGLECRNEKHGASHHWDGREFVDFLVQVRTMLKPEQEMYIHNTYVPSFICENLATELLTEEVTFPVIGPEMFSPHVHFMNTAPRQICDMLSGRLATEENRHKLAMCAVLHHATVACSSPAVLKFYKENLYWMDTVTDYTRHHAPGEGFTRVTDPENIGLAYYENDREVLLVFANLTNDSRDVDWKIATDSLKGRISLPPMAVTTRRLARETRQL